MAIELGRDAALVAVDVQNDFCPGGALAVPEGDQVVPIVNQYAEHFSHLGLPVYASRDWHPPETKHFQRWGGIWPPHCVQGTPGAEFHRQLQLPPSATVVSKGMDPEQDSYSAFDAVEPAGAALEQSLHQRSIRHLYVCGLATDYCVKWTVAESLRRGFYTTLLLDGIRGVNLKPHDSEEAIEEMVREGSEVATLVQLGIAQPARA